MSSINGSSETSPFHHPKPGVGSAMNGGVGGGGEKKQLDGLIGSAYPGHTSTSPVTPTDTAALSVPRTMADITRLFMSGASATPPNPNRPQRISPQARNGTAPTPSAPSTLSPAADIAVSNTANPVSAHCPQPKPLTMESAVTMDTAALSESVSPFVTVQNILSTITGPGADETLHRLAQGMAAKIKGAVGLIYVRDNGLCVERVEGRTPARFLATQYHNAQTLADVHLARILFSLQHNVEHWLIVPPNVDATNAQSPPSPNNALATLRKQLLTATPNPLLLTGIGRDDVLLAYRLLKEFSSYLPEPDGSIQVVVDGPAEQSRPVLNRLISTSRDFLGLTLDQLVLPATTGAALEQVVRIELAHLSAETRNSLWMAVGDMVTELTGPMEVEEEFPEPSAEFSEPDFTPPPLPKHGREPDMLDLLDADERAALAAALPSEPAGLPPHQPLPPATPAPRHIPDLIGQAAPVPPPHAYDLLPKMNPTKIPAITTNPVPVIPASKPAPVIPATRPTQTLNVAPAATLKSPVHVVVPVAETKPTPVTPPAGPTPHPQDVLQAVDCPIMPTSSSELWPLVRTALTNLQAQQTPLAASLPFGQGMLTADTSGQLHLWILVDRQNPIGWSLLANWAKQNRQLIALTQHPHPANLDPQLNLHLIIPPNPTPELLHQNHAIQLGHTPNLNYYRVMPLIWNARTGLVVIPQA